LLILSYFLLTKSITAKCKIRQLWIFYKQNQKANSYIIRKK
jgi:hypothetical protein